MNKIYFLLNFLLFCSFSHSQTLGGYTIVDYLDSVTHPISCIDDYVLGPPDDSLWVNVQEPDTIVTAYFMYEWTDAPGTELLLETGFHRDNYSVRMLLADGSYSAVHLVDVSDWIEITEVDWYYLGTCISFSSSLNEERYILPLDFDADFGLSGWEAVQGIEITFLETSGSADLGGVYITEQPCSNSSSEIDVTQCDSYTSPSGNYTWTSSDEYYDTIPNVSGCDSAITINLVINTLTASVTQDGDLLTADLPGASYQWIKCPDFTSIVGEINQDFLVTSDGDYAVIIVNKGCTDTSECIRVITSSIFNSNNGSNEFKILTNPINGQLTIDLVEEYEFISVKIMDINGSQIQSDTFFNNQILNIEIEKPKGIYYLSIETEKGLYYERIFKY